jgi:hypothetical protein
MFRIGERDLGQLLSSRCGDMILADMSTKTKAPDGAEALKFHRPVNGSLLCYTAGSGSGILRMSVFSPIASRDAIPKKLRTCLQLGRRRLVRDTDSEPRWRAKKPIKRGVTSKARTCDAGHIPTRQIKLGCNYMEADHVGWAVE